MVLRANPVRAPSAPRSLRGSRTDGPPDHSLRRPTPTTTSDRALMGRLGMVLRANPVRVPSAPRSLRGTRTDGPPDHSLRRPSAMAVMSVMWEDGDRRRRKFAGGWCRVVRELPEPTTPTTTSQGRHAGRVARPSVYTSLHAIRCDHHRRRPRRRRGSRACVAGGRAHTHAHAKPRDDRADVVQPRHRGHRQGHGGARGGRAWRRDGSRDGHGPDPVPHAEPLEGPCRLVAHAHSATARCIGARCASFSRRGPISISPRAPRRRS